MIGEIVAIGTHIKFQDAGPSDSGKTHRWIVRAIADNVALGTIQWWPSWRKYTYCPIASTVYEHVCLREIAEFFESRTGEQKRKTK